MPEVKSVTAQVYAPDRGDQGQVTTGYYTCEGGVLTMTLADGTPVLDEAGQPITQQLSIGDDGRVVASILTKSVRRLLRGETEAQERFNRPLGYPRMGVA